MNPGFDVSFQVTIPNEWERVATKNIGVTAGIEVDKISPVWVEKSALVDKIIVCSEFAKSAFDNTSYQVKNNETGEVTNDWRCRTPVEVVPIEVRKLRLMELLILALIQLFQFSFCRTMGTTQESRFHDQGFWMSSRTKKSLFGLTNVQQIQLQTENLLL